MLIRWLQQVLFGAQRVQNGSTVGPSPSASSDRIDGKLLDVVREALKDEAAELGELVAHGLPAVRRRRVRARFRKKVRQVINPALNAPEVVEEVTERLANVAEVDPYYARLFADDETK